MKHFLGDREQIRIHCTCIMVDWLAMSMHFGGTVENYYNNEKDRINLPREGTELIEDILVRLR